MPRAKAATTNSNSINTNISINSNSETKAKVEDTKPKDTKPKRRGRPPIKKDCEEKHAPKKRGRKPKGGKIIANTQINVNNNNNKENIIVHLKCSTALLHQHTSNSNTFDSQLNTNSKNNCNLNTNINNVNSVNSVNNSHINYFNINKETIKVNTMFEQAKKDKSNNSVIALQPNNSIINTQVDDDKKKRKRENEIIEKLKEMQQNLKHDNVCLTESNCFWCTYSFENPPIHIPKHIIKDVYHVYGCFCSPECATAFLFDENIDNSTRFERYSLLCSLYTKIFKYDKNIKPAPNPYYTLDKYCGNLSIIEYRELFNSNRLLFVISKPVTRELPELDIVDSNIFN